MVGKFIVFLIRPVEVEDRVVKLGLFVRYSAYAGGV